MSKPQVEDVRELPQTTTLQLTHLWRNYLKVFIAGWIPGGVLVALAAWTTVYQDSAVQLWRFGLHNYWFFPVCFIFLCFLGYINRPRKRKGGASKK